jgi:hypothetical protein
MKHYIAILGEFALEEGLLQDRLHNEWCVSVCVHINMWSFPRVTGGGDKAGHQNVGHQPKFVAVDRLGRFYCTVSQT